MRTFQNSTRRELIKTLRAALDATQKGMVLDLHDCAQMMRPFREIALEGERDKAEAEYIFDCVTQNGSLGPERIKERNNLAKLMNTRDPRTIDDSQTSTPDAQISELTKRDVSHLLRVAIRAIQMGMVEDLADCALVLHGIRYVAIGEREDGETAAEEFDTSMLLGHSWLEDQERRARLAAFIDSMDPRCESLCDR